MPLECTSTPLPASHEAADTCTAEQACAAAADDMPPINEAAKVPNVTIMAETDAHQDLDLFIFPPNLSTNSLNLEINVTYGKQNFESVLLEVDEQSSECRNIVHDFVGSHRVNLIRSEKGRESVPRANCLTS
jgi:hypothetical protein